MDPVRIRELNALRAGDTTATGQKLGRDTSALKVLREAVARTDFRRRRRAARRDRAAASASRCSSTAPASRAAGEVKLASRASLELTEPGRANPRGQRRDRPGRAHRPRADRRGHARPGRSRRSRWPAPTRRGVPDSGPTVASRTTMVVGGLLERCARKMKRRLNGLAPDEYLRRHGPLVVTKQYRPPTSAAFDEDDVPGGRLRHLRLGVRRRRSRAGPGDVRGPPGAVHRGAGDRPGDQPDAGRRADRGRHAAGHRVRAARGSGDARRPDGQRAAHQLRRARPPWIRPRSTSSSWRTGTGTGRLAPRVSANCRSTAPRQPSPTPSAISDTTFAACPSRLRSSPRCQTIAGRDSSPAVGAGLQPRPGCQHRAIHTERQDRSTSARTR